MKIIARPALNAAMAALAVGSPAFADPADDMAASVLAKSPVIDGHNDTPAQIRDLFNSDFAKFDLHALAPEQVAKTHTDIAHIRSGHLGGQFWSVYVDAKLPADEAFARVVEQIDVVQQMAARYPDAFTLARTARDVEAAMKAGRVASLIGMEGGHPIGMSLARLRELRRLGVGYMTITHSKTSPWADSATDAPQHDGLSPFGVEVIKEMNRIGMLVDLSHVSEATMNDALDVSKAPVIFSHSSARALVDHPRNIPDAVLARLKANGGVAMVTFVPNFVSQAYRDWDNAQTGEKARLDARYSGDPEAAKRQLAEWEAAHPAPQATLAQVADHIDHIRKVAGIDHVGIGGDFGGVDVLPKGLETVATYPALFAELARRGYSRDDLAKIAQGNILRVMRAAETVSAR